MKQNRKDGPPGGLIGSRGGHPPKRTDLSGYTQSELDKVALRLNQRPRKTLGFRLLRVNFEPVLRPPPDLPGVSTLASNKDTDWLTLFGSTNLSYGLFLHKPFGVQSCTNVVTGFEDS